MDIFSPAITDITVAEVSATRALIQWRTDEEATSRIDYGENGLYLQYLESDEFTTEHAMELTNLTPGGDYRFRVRSRDLAGNLADSWNTVYFSNN